jgi:pimeloyl-ACP methyl ester carboxylesterase
MKIIMVPGFWLDASSWDDVLPPIVTAGHDPVPLTLPGKERLDADRSHITLRDHVDAVIAVIDDAPEEKVVLVGHSGGGAIIIAATDARPDRVARNIYVDSGPLRDGGVINDELPMVDGEIPLPDWDVFDKEDLIDMDESQREALRARAIPEPAGVATGRQVLTNPARRSVPATVITCEFSSDQIREWMAEDEKPGELGSTEDYEFIDLPTGHWPQFTRPVELGEMIAEAASR